MATVENKDMARRFESNPILRPADVRPSREGWVVESLLNPGAFEYGGRIGLLMRVAERPPQEQGIWVGSIERFVEIDVAPGETFDWKRNYRFF